MLLLLKEAQALVTHSSHLLVVTLFCCLTIHMYLQPSTNGPQTKFMSVILLLCHPAYVPAMTGLGEVLDSCDLCLSPRAAK